MTYGLVRGSCSDYGFSRWDSDDHEDPKYLKMRECHLGTMGSNSANEWMDILGKQMLCRRGKHYFVREGELIQDFTNGMVDAKNALIGMLLAGRKTVDISAIPPGLIIIREDYTSKLESQARARRCFEVG